MSMNANCELSAEVRRIHDNLPFVSNLNRSSAVENATIFEVSGADYVIRAIFWGLFIPLMAGFLLVVSCYCYCCACCACGALRRRGSHSLGLKVVLGIINIVILAVCVILLFVGFWAESSLNKGLVDYATDIENLTTNYSEADVASFIVLSIEHTRHTIFLVYLCLLLGMCVAMLIVVSLAPVCKTGAVIYTFLGFFAFVTLITSVISGFIFAVIVLLADTCVALYDLPLQFCEDESLAPLTDSLNTFCNKSFHYGFVQLILACVLIVLFVAVQIFSMYFGASISNKRQSETVSTTSGDVWDAYEPSSDRNYSPHDAFAYNSDRESMVPLMSVVDD